MNKYLLIGSVVIIVGIGGWIFFNQVPAPSVTAEQPVQNTPAPQAPAEASSDVENISWHIESSNAPVSEDQSYLKDEQLISVDVTFSDKSTKRYALGRTYGCKDANINALYDGTPVLGQVSCYYAATGVAFTAYDRNGKIVIERFDEDASGRTDGKRTVVLEI